MEDFGRVWHLALALTLIVSAVGMPQNPRYQGSVANAQNIIYMQALRDLATVRVSSFDSVTSSYFNIRERQSKAPKKNNFFKDEKLVDGFIDASLADLSVPNNTVKVVKPSRGNGSHINNKNYRVASKISNKLVKINQSTTVLNANNTLYHKGTVGGSTTTKKTKISTTTKKPRISTTTKKTKIGTTTKKPKIDTTTKDNMKPLKMLNQKNYTITVKHNGTKPIRRIIKPLKTNNLKQNDDFLVYHIPSPDPMPEVTSYSPENNLNPNIVLPNPNSGSLIPLDAVETSSNGYPVLNDPDPDDDGPGLNIPLGQVDFNMYPIRTQSTGVKLADGEEFDPLCPSLHLSTNIFGPQSKQACPPLNIVVNSHFQQSMLPERAPTTFADAPVGTAADAPIAAAADTPVVAQPVAAPLADTVAAPAAASPVSAPAAAAPAASSGGGTNGIGFPMLPELPKLPDLKGLFGVLRGLWSIISWLFRFIWPILVAVPTIVFFKSLFVAFVVLFPWWLPVLIIAGKTAGKKEQKKKIYVKHIHKPVVVYHPDGWFWNQNTKSWSHLNGSSAKPYDTYVDNDRSDNILSMINNFREKYFGRRSPVIGDNLKQLTVSLLESINATAPTKYQSPVSTFDTRTPPKVKQQMKKDKIEEKSHPGVAEPVEDEDLILEEHEKKLNYYKVDKPTTDSGLSTWILLSGQASSTIRPMKKPVSRNVTNTYIVEDGHVDIKPLFKRRSTTKKPTTTTEASTTTASKATKIAATTSTARPIKLTKVKASLLAGVNKNATNFSKKPTTVKTTTVSATTPKPTKATKVTTVTTTKKPTTEFVKVSTSNAQVISNLTSSIVLAPEAKDGELDLANNNSTTTNNKKTRKPSTTHKRKKNKTKKRRPTAEDKVDLVNVTNKVITKNKEKPFGTQIYNYLSREVMPTVGVGLVGLMVTAGLASYFLYPFGPARRSYEVDRKDKVASYYYNDEYSGGIAEEEAIGKVIAGMPQNGNSNYNNIRPQNSRNSYNRYRNVDQRYMQGSVETVKLNHKSTYQNDDVIIGSPKAAYNEDTENPEEAKFVVGNVPKEFQESAEVVATPAIVPEHGPRNINEKEDVFVVHSVPATETTPIKIEHGPRRRRQADEENEIDVDGDKSTEIATDPPTTTTTSSTTIPPATTTKNPIVVKTESIIHLLKDLFYFKIRMGLEILQNKTESLTKYFRTAQSRIDDAYKTNHPRRM